MSCRVLITGGGGMLATALVEHLHAEHDVTAADRCDMDVTSRAQIEAQFHRSSPDVIIHTAAWTDVDGCEADPKRARLLNVDGTRNVAEVCHERAVRMIFCSTDYVFDGAKKAPYLESDPPNPINVYGNTKLEAERIIQETVEDGLILRLGGLYSWSGRNFVQFVIQHLTKQPSGVPKEDSYRPLPVAADQVASPTWSTEVARQIAALMASELVGVVHVTAEGQTSWYDFAVMICKRLGLDARVQPCRLSDLNRAAPRPLYSALENERLKKAGLNLMKPYHEAFNEFVSCRAQDAAEKIERCRQR